MTRGRRRSDRLRQGVVFVILANGTLRRVPLRGLATATRNEETDVVRRLLELVRVLFSTVHSGEVRVHPLRIRGGENHRRGLGALILGLVIVLQSLGCSSTAQTQQTSDSGLASDACLPLDAGLPVAAPWLGVDAGPSGEPLEQFADDYFSAFCHGMSRCFPFESYLIPNCIEQLQSFGVWVSPTTCFQTDVGLGCDAVSIDLTEIQAHVSAVGARLSYDATSAAECLAEPWTVCPERYNEVSLPPSCGAVFGGLVPDGGACDFDLECAAGVCSTPGSCAGTCAPPTTQPVPVPLGPGSFCAFGGACGGDPGLTCDGQFCRGDAGTGSSCGPDPFYGFYRCSVGLFCDPTSTTCQPQIAKGGPCATGFFHNADPYGRCQQGLICAGEAVLVDGGARLGTCEPPSSFGAACTELASDEAQHSSGCVVGGVCSCGVCVPPPTSGACADGWAPCLPGVSACDYVGAGTCQPLSSFQNCSNGQQCVNGYCDISTNTCSDAPLLDACPG